MTQLSNQTLELARKLRENLAGTNLPRTFAKLYSQHTRLSEKQSGLQSWQEEEMIECLNDAIRLLEAAFIERGSGNESWRDSVRRTGELLEWLSHPQLNPDELPLLLLSAASYQLAGYPARSLGLLNEDISESTESKIVRFLLKAEFPILLRHLTKYWSANISSLLPINTSSSRFKAEGFSNDLQERIVRETASSLGILCAEMRWGNETRLGKALEKLTDVGKVLLHTYDPYSWLLAKLCAEVSSVYIESSMRHNLAKLSEALTQEGKEAIDRYLRQSYQTNKALAWPSQIRGIENLIGGNSFALCTPTGSGKTTIAEIAILQSLFLNGTSVSLLATAPLALYLVPSKALATEVESKLAKVLVTLNEPPIVVTGLYGGTDWGPTDAWLTSNEPTILICTYEKAEALIRFLSSLFLDRISLIVIDEAHMVQFIGQDRTALRTSESRALRLESLGARLFTYLDKSKGRVIALSAMASSMENTLARWVTGSDDARPAKATYRSTRQLVGRLECLPNRGFRIFYDLLDGSNLQLQFENENQAEIPYIHNPFQSCPITAKWENKKINQGPEKRLRPYLFWAAMQLASPGDKGKQRSVLISITQNIGGYAEDLLTLLKTDWSQVDLPPFFQQPTEPAKLEVWKKCLLSCEDYFGNDSREYQLLQKGIVVHHGRMPGLMARYLIEVIQEQIVHIVMATSTLSEGVNLPFETILIPSLLRRGNSLNVQEFGNLVGRAGRPGFGTEGRSLVLLDSEPSASRIDEGAWQIRGTRKRYFNLIDDLIDNSEIDKNKEDARSPLAELLIYLEEQWQMLTSSMNRTDFLLWLEKTAPIAVTIDPDDNNLHAVEALDSLDSLLLSIVVEAEQAKYDELSNDEIEKRLHEIWNRTYAYYASQEETRLEEAFIKRGKALLNNIYPNPHQRRKLYRTSIPPRSGNKLLSLYPEIIQHLKSGEEYAVWTNENRFAYIRKIVELLKSLPHFNIKDHLGKGKNQIAWDKILGWWLTANSRGKTPSDISEWHKFVSDNFVYRFNWGLGSVISLALDEANNGHISGTSLESWQQTGLPWIALWLKEIIIWGTLEPIAAYLLSKGVVTTRKQAEDLAKLYYNEKKKQQEYYITNDILNATIIRDWATVRFKGYQSFSRMRPPNHMNIDLLRNFENTQNQFWRVLPVEVENNIYWFDPAGFPLASCPKPEGWNSSFLDSFDFSLDSFERVVLPAAYL